MTDRERVHELSSADGRFYVDDDDPVWGSVLSALGQAAHAKLSRKLGIGAPNSIDTTVAAARLKALPRPKRGDEWIAESAQPAKVARRRLAVHGREVTERETLSLMGETWLRTGDIAHTLGGDVRSVGKALASLESQGKVQRRGNTRGTEWRAWQEPPADETDGEVA